MWIGPENAHQRAEGQTRAHPGGAGPNGRSARETILFLEKGKYNPSLKLACKIALALQASIDEIFIFEEEDLK